MILTSRLMMLEFKACVGRGEAVVGDEPKNSMAQ
jgi:hypothetical protein